MSVIAGVLALVSVEGVVAALGVSCLIQHRVSRLYTALGLIYLLAALAWPLYLVTGFLGAMMMAMDDHLLRSWTTLSSVALSLAGLGVLLMALWQRLRLVVWLSLPTLLPGIVALESFFPGIV